MLRCAEINSSFHRPHTAATYARWAAATPDGFEFAVKVPRTITHDQKLRRAQKPLDEFLAQSAGLGTKRGPLLVQLPPSLGFDARVAGRFFGLLRERFEGHVVCEPRHATWFMEPATVLLMRHTIARVAADPPPTPGADQPGAWNGVAYFRLHGSPRKYWSAYEQSYLQALTRSIDDAAASADVWCIFDNTASGAALGNALDIHRRTKAMEPAGGRR